MSVPVKALSVVVALLAAHSASAADGPSARRLTGEQYRQTIEDIFGAGIELGGRFEPDVRKDGLLEVGAAQVSVTASGFEQYDGMARAIAAQVMDKARRDMVMPCTPQSDTAPDEICARQFLAKAGRLLFRRPLDEVEIRGAVKVANDTSQSLKNFHAGIERSLANMLVSPLFLFRFENVEPDPAQTGGYRLDAYSKASRLSFLLWNAAPDNVLLTAAEKGELHTPQGLARQVDRLLASYRLKAGIEAFFADMLQFDQFAALSKDSMIYPKFTPKAERDAREQTLRTIVDVVVTQRGDYRDIFTTRKTFLTATLGALYGVAVADARPIGEPEGWLPYEFPKESPRAGILTHASFVALHAHPGRSSPTLRGKALREIFLCQKVPDPPGNVDFTLIQQTNNPTYKTARERLTAHSREAMCGGCHKLIDPIGMALENFDGVGDFRRAENGAPIDTKGALDGAAFADAAMLGQAVHDHPATATCVVNRAMSYAMGRAPGKQEQDLVTAMTKNFAGDGYRIPALLRRIATNDAFFTIAARQSAAATPPESPR